MDRNLSWTRALENAYESEPQNVLNAVQVMRQRAQQAGTLESTPQQTVTTEGQTITIEPAEQDTVYLPEYDPWLVYGASVPAYPGWNEGPGLVVNEPDVLFGLGFGIGGFAAVGCGYHHWGADWHEHHVIYDHHTYFTRAGPSRPTTTPVTHARHLLIPAASVVTRGTAQAAWVMGPIMVSTMVVLRGHLLCMRGLASVVVFMPPPEVSTPAVGSMAAGIGSADAFAA
jgi:hypothetical protein